MSVRAIPEGFNTVSVYLIVPNAVEALAFYEKAFGASAGVRMPGPDGQSTMHAEMHLGDSTIMLTDENPQWGAKGPKAYGGCSASLHVYVEDADALFNRAVEAGCEVRYPIEDAFWGDRYGKLEDPYGYTWGISTHQEDLTPEEVDERAKKWIADMAAQGEGCGE